MNNTNFRSNFYEISRHHNPCLVAHLETKMSNHMSHKDEFAFDDFFDVPVVENSGGIVLIYLSHIIQVSLKNHRYQEVYAKI